MNKLHSIAPTGARILLGLIFAIFGLNGFLQFIPMPPPQGPAAEFLGGLAATGYFFPMMATTQLLVGLALLANRFTALALVVLAPITINIVAFHGIAPEGLPLALLIVVLHVGLAWHFRSTFSPLLKPKVQA